MTRYRVNSYVIAVVSLDMEAGTPEEAAEKAASDSMRMDWAIKSGKASYAEEIDGALVDMDGDEEYENSVYLLYDAMGEKFIRGNPTTLSERLKRLAYYEGRERREADAERGRRWMYPPIEDDKGPFNYEDDVRQAGRGE